jgi:hypothetical protein
MGLEQDPRDALRPLPLARPIGDQILPDLELRIRMSLLLAVNGDGVAGLDIDAVGLVVAHIESRFSF